MESFKHKEPLDKTKSNADLSEIDVPTVFDYDLVNFSSSLRTGFTLAVTILCAIAICGNIASIVVNYRRKMRPFFRSCLVSLAVNDLLTSIFSSATYLTQFSSDYIQMWYLGEVMCNFIPFITTAAILCSSMTLVCIASDRYYAVMPSSTSSKWHFNRITSVTGMVLISGLAICISSPMIAFYNTFTIYVVITDPKNSTHYVEAIPHQMCASDKAENAYYYVVILSLIFIPSLVAFVWLNTILATKLWKRRRTFKNRTVAVQPTHSLESLEVTENKKREENYINKDKSLNISSINNTPITLTMPPTNSQSSSSLIIPVIATSSSTQFNHSQKKPEQSKASKCREARHIRMFYVVIVLMALFIFFRLPAWIFLIIRMYGNYVTTFHWILHFSFGVLTLTSCVLNPFLYTFLLETMEQINICIKAIHGCCGLGICLRLCCIMCHPFERNRSENQQDTRNEITLDETQDNSNNESYSVVEISLDVVPKNDRNFQMVYTIQPGII